MPLANFQLGERCGPVATLNVKSPSYVIAHGGCWAVDACQPRPGARSALHHRSSSSVTSPTSTVTQCSPASLCMSQSETGANLVENCIDRPCFSRSLLDRIYAHPANIIATPLLCSEARSVLFVSSCQSKKGTSAENLHLVGQPLERIGLHRCCPSPQFQRISSRSV